MTIKEAGLASKAVHFWDSVSRKNLDQAKKTVEGVQSVLEHQGKNPDKYREALRQNHRFLSVASKRLRQVEHQTKKDTLKGIVGAGALAGGVFGAGKGYQAYQNHREENALEDFYGSWPQTKQASVAGALGKLLKNTGKVINTAGGGPVKTFWETAQPGKALKSKQLEAKVLSKLPKKEQLERIRSSFPEREKELKQLHHQRSIARVAVGTGAGAAGYGAYKLLKNRPVQPQPQQTYYTY